MKEKAEVEAEENCEKGQKEKKKKKYFVEGMSLFVLN